MTGCSLVVEIAQRHKKGDDTKSGHTRSSRKFTSAMSARAVAKRCGGSRERDGDLRTSLRSVYASRRVVWQIVGVMFCILVVLMFRGVVHVGVDVMLACCARCVVCRQRVGQGVFCAGGALCRRRRGLLDVLRFVLAEECAARTTS